MAIPAPHNCARFGRRHLLAFVLFGMVAAHAPKALALDTSSPIANGTTDDASRASTDTSTDAAASSGEASVTDTPSAHDGDTTEETPLTDVELQALLDALEADAAATAPDTGDASRNRRVGAAILSAIQPEMALILDLSLAYFSDSPLQLGSHDPQRTGFNFNQLEMSFSANVDPYFLFRANLVFSQFGVEVEEAYAQTTSLPGRFQLRAGQFLNRVGRINATHPHSWSFLDQPLVNGKFFGGEGQRGLGMEVNWLAPTPFYLELVGSVMHGEGECCARSFDGGTDVGIHGPQDFLYLLSAKSLFAFGPSWSLSWGASALMGPNATGYNNRTDIYGTDLYLRFRPVTSTRYTAFSLTMELLHRRRQVPSDLLVDTGLYLQAVWNINRRWEVGARYEWVSGHENDPLDPEWHSARHRLSAQGTLYPSHFSRIRLQANYDNPTWRPQPIWAAILGVEFVVGAHGAHAF